MPHVTRAGELRSPDTPWLNVIVSHEVVLALPLEDVSCFKLPNAAQLMTLESDSVADMEVICQTSAT